MRVADGAPGEEVGKTGDREQPSENRASLGSLVDVSEAAEQECDDQADVRTALLVDQGSPFRSHTANAQCLHSTGRTEGARVGHGDDGQCNDGVEN